jgi:hypothetical protein
MPELERFDLGIHDDDGYEAENGDHDADEDVDENQLQDLDGSVRKVDYIERSCFHHESSDVNGDDGK